MDTKRFDAFEVKSEPSGEFDALISTFDRADTWGDIVRRGAFRDTIAAWRAKGAMVPVVFAHQAEDIDQYIGEVDPKHLEETAVGLRARGRLFLDEERARKVFKQLGRKTLSQWSFAFLVKRKRALASGGRELLALDLLELGPCLAGAGHTETIAVKSTSLDTDPHAADRVRLDLAQRRVAFALAVARQG